MKRIRRNVYLLFFFRFSDAVSFASPEQTTIIRADRKFNRSLLTIAIGKVKQLTELPEYRQIRHSPTTLLQLSQITTVLYVRCVQRLANIGDLKLAQLSAECFYQCIAVAHSLYRRKFIQFLQTIGKISCFGFLFVFIFLVFKSI